MRKCQDWCTINARDLYCINLHSNTPQTYDQTDHLTLQQVDSLAVILRNSKNHEYHVSLSVNEAVLKKTTGLWFTQVIIGVLSTIFGKISVNHLHHWHRRFGHFGWGGILVVIGGLFGIFSASIKSNPYLNWTNISFAIVSSFHGFISFIFYCFTVGYYNQARHNSFSHDVFYSHDPKHDDTGVKVFSVLLVLSLVEFITAIAVASYCCKLGCSCCCCNYETQVMNEAVEKTARGYGITHVIIGVLSILFWALSVESLRDSHGYLGNFGLGGILLVIGGIFGIFSASIKSNPCLNWANMSFAIVSLFHGIISFIVYCVALGYYIDEKHSSSSDDYTAIAFFSILLVLSLVQFTSAIRVASFYCKFGWSCCCCNDETEVDVIHQQPHFVPLSAIQETSTVSPALHPVNTCMAAPYAAASYPEPSLAATNPVVSCPVPESATNSIKEKH